MEAVANVRAYIHSFEAVLGGQVRPEYQGVLKKSFKQKYLLKLAISNPGFESSCTSSVAEFCIGHPGISLFTFKLIKIVIF